MELANVLCRGTNHRQQQQPGKTGIVCITPPMRLLGVTLERLFRLKTIEYLLCSRAKNVCVGRVRAETLRRRAMLMYEFVGTVGGLGGGGGGVKTASEPCQMSLVAPAGSAGPEG